MIPFNVVIVDTLNLAYKVLEDRYKKTRFQNKSVYTKLFNSFVEAIREIESKYLATDGNVILLFDNADSRQDLQDTFYNVKRKNVYPEYKVHRKKDNIDFYQTLDLIKYYYLVNSERYMCIQIPNLEADDLLKPVLENYVKSNERALFVTNDSDWSRYLSDRCFMLDHLNSDPMSIEDYSRKLGFPVTENNVIIYKSLFGDSADNIPQIIPKTQKNLEMFNDLIKHSFKDSIDIAIEARKGSFEIFKLPEFKKQVGDKDSLYKIDQFIINLKLTSTFPIETKHLLAATTMGRNLVKLKEAVERATGLLTSQKKFSFGLKPPRS